MTRDIFDDEVYEHKHLRSKSLEFAQHNVYVKCLAAKR